MLKPATRIVPLFVTMMNCQSLLHVCHLCTTTKLHLAAQTLCSNGTQSMFHGNLESRVQWTTLTGHVSKHISFIMKLLYIDLIILKYIFYFPLHPSA